MSARLLATKSDTPHHPATRPQAHGRVAAAGLVRGRPRRVFGIDPGLARFGWAVIERRGSQACLLTAGRLTTAAGQRDSLRLRHLYEKLQTLMHELKPDHIAIEKLFFSRNVSTAMTVGQARGIALLVAAQAHIPVAEFTPTAIKQAIAGDGRADKKQIQSMLKILLRLDRAPTSDDMADAMAVALCALHARILSDHG